MTIYADHAGTLVCHAGVGAVGEEKSPQPPNAAAAAHTSTIGEAADRLITNG
jgi:hypothetical protein